MNFAARMEEVVARILRDEVTVAQIPGGLGFWLVRDPSAKEGFHMNPSPPDWEGLSDAAMGFVGTEERPPNYPPDVPFLASSVAIVNPTLAGHAVLWMTCPNPLHGFCRILDQCQAAGWTGPRSENVELATQEDRGADFTKPGRLRQVRLNIFGSSGSWSLTLRDVPTERSGDA